MKQAFTKAALCGTTCISAFALFGATPAFAQEAPQTAVAAEEDDSNIIIVTGSLLRRTDTETPSPVTTLSAETLQERGINTAAEAVQRLSANNAGTIQQGWNTGFNFASGANAPALRGLTVQSTLSISDGLRMAPFPLADDGQRNFVDLNTIPSAIIERIEILRDGASSTYGADAIAGVINIITKKEIQGLHLNGSAGISQRGDAGEQRIDATWGYGDLDDQGFNFYVSGEYQRQSPLFARDRGYPFNSTDLTGICSDSGSCMANHNWNGVTPEDGSFNGLISIPGVTLIRPVAAGAASGNGRFQFLNPAAGCRNWPSVTVPVGASATAPATACEIDTQQAYIMLQPKIERKGLTARFTANVGERAQVYAMANYYNTKTSASFTPIGLNGTPTPPRASTVTAYNVLLPVYVCAAGVGTLSGNDTGCNATNGTLNPQNPFASQGLRAQAFLRSPFGRAVDTSARSLRGVLGVDGSFGNDWRYTANFTASEVKLTRLESNYFIPQRIMDVVARGSFNFSDPYANSQDIWDYIAPQSRKVSTSKLWQVQGTVAKDLMELQGGPLQALVGVAYRKESIDDPSANAANDAAPYSRYYGINSVGTKGSRNVKSGYFEIAAPILDQLELTASGRYDKYSTGQKNFSPKIGVKVKPVDQLVVRGTWSKGFRIPSFNEAFGLPTTGYVTRSVNCATFAAYCAAHGNNAYATAPYTVGLTQVGNPALDPEKSTSFTAGIVFEPIRNVSLTVDFWRIKVKDLIVGVTNTSAAESAYYANNGNVNLPGQTAIPGVPDPAFPNALPALGFIQSSFKNADQQVVQGLDFAVNARLPIGNTMELISNFDASYLMKYKLTTEDGSVYRYEGTLSPCNITSCSGAPKWRASWQNTLKMGGTSVSLTAYYTSGYDTASLDFGGVKGDCQGNTDIASSTQGYVDGSPVLCKAKATWNADMTISHEINDKFTIYANVLNVFDIKAPFEPSAAYSLFQFNPAWAGPNVLGRYFKIGAKVDF